MLIKDGGGQAAAFRLTREPGDESEPRHDSADSLGLYPRLLVAASTANLQRDFLFWLKSIPIQTRQTGDLPDAVSSVL